MEIRQCCRTSNGSATVVQIPMEVRQLSKRQWKFDIVQIQILEFWLSKFYGTNGTSVGYETRYILVLKIIRFLVASVILRVYGRE